MTEPSEDAASSSGAGSRRGCACEDVAETLSAPVQDPAPGAGPERAGPAPLVLVIEDSKTYSELLRRRLEDREAFRVHVARSMAEVRSFLAEPPDDLFAAICDLHLPDAQESEIVDHVLERVPTVLVMTASLDEEIRQRIVSKNIADYVVKESTRDIDYLVTALKRLHRHQGTKVLLVDDSATYRHILESQLRSQRYEVLIAHDGAQGLQMLEQHPDVRVVVTDYQMPNMDGFELVSRIRQQHGMNELAIIGLSAQSGDLVSARFLKKGANDFLVKPFSKEEFFCRISQNLEMMDLFAEIKNSANRDYLTGLYNRRYFFELGRRYFENARRNNLSLTAVMIDIDFFKAVNDSFGHDAGDVALRQVAQTLEANLRKTDIVARFGGEEFCLLLVNALDEHLALLLERLRAAVEALDIQVGDRRIGLTISIGAMSGEAVSLADMVRIADEKLYEAKQNGRNRVEIADS